MILLALASAASAAASALALPESIIATTAMPILAVHPEYIALQTATTTFAATFGFGDAVIAMPMFSLLFGLAPRQAAPLVTTVS